jgi:hypothetical protein
MHIHPTQVNQSTEMNSTYVAERAAAQREVENTRKKLLSMGYEPDSELEAEACVVELAAATEPRQPRPRPGPREGRKPARNNSEPESAGNAVSDWA